MFPISEPWYAISTFRGVNLFLSNLGKNDAKMKEKLQFIVDKITRQIISNFIDIVDDYAKLIFHK